MCQILRSPYFGSITTFVRSMIWMLECAVSGGEMWVLSLTLGVLFL